jgi:adenosylhomocysteine nucleosidase
MLLRWLVNQFLRDHAETALRDVVGNVGNIGKATATRTRQSAREPTLDEHGQPITEEFLPCEAAVIFALGIESGGLVDKLKDKVTTRCKSHLEHAGELQGKQVVLVDAGVGAEAAARATAETIEFYKPAWVISAGFAGALVDDLRRGQMLMADHIVDLTGREISVGLKVSPKPGLHIGRLLTVPELVGTEAEKRRLGIEHQALACDMESFAVAEACSFLNTRFLSVRIISDAVDQELPKEVDVLLKQKSIAAKIGAAAGALLNRPSSAKDMWQLREDALLASDRLAKFLLGVVGQLS